MGDMNMFLGEYQLQAPVRVSTFLGPRGPLRVIPSVRPSRPVHPQSFYFSHLQPSQRHRNKGTATKNSVQIVTFS